MKRTVGVTVVDGEVVEVKKEIYQCVCIKGREFTHPINLSPNTPNGFPRTDKNFEKDSFYEFYIDEDSTSLEDGIFIFNNHSVYVENNFKCNMTKDEFDEHFIEITEYREKRLKGLLG